VARGGRCSCAGRRAGRRARRGAQTSGRGLAWEDLFEIEIAEIEIAEIALEAMEAVGRRRLAAQRGGGRRIAGCLGVLDLTCLGVRLLTRLVAV
jgi:CRISPR/Cas system endoribonuclease Cas6 (RAMP superfamily)